MKTTAHAKCTHPGCNETAHWNFDSRREAAEHYPRRQKWKYTRHTKPDEVLGLSNLKLTKTLEAKKVNGFGGKPLRGLFWKSDESSGGNGFCRGTGYKAYADDFPEGTKIVVTAEIILP